LLELYARFEGVAGRPVRHVQAHVAVLEPDLVPTAKLDNVELLVEPVVAQVLLGLAILLRSYHPQTLVAEAVLRN